MQDRGAISGLALGGVGLVLGLGAVVTSQPVLGLVAGACALGAGGLPIVLGGRTRSDESAATTVVQPYRTPEPEVMGPTVYPSPIDRDQRADRFSAMEDEQSIGAEPAMAPRTDNDTLTDPTTGLYIESYLMVSLDARIAAARRRLRPVSVAMIEVVYGLQAGNPMVADPAVVAAAVRATLREADTAAVMNDGRFVLVLEDTPENGAIWTVERLRSFLVSDHPDHTVWAGVACYPAHAFNLDEIIQQATAALNNAREWQQDRIEVAHAE